MKLLAAISEAGFWRLDTQQLPSSRGCRKRVGCTGVVFVVQYIIGLPETLRPEEAHDATSKGKITTDWPGASFARTWRHHLRLRLSQAACLKMAAVWPAASSPPSSSILSPGVCLALVLARLYMQHFGRRQLGLTARQSPWHVRPGRAFRSGPIACCTYGAVHGRAADNLDSHTTYIPFS
ncbi:hypothetical protein CC78DRAFT_579561 [Lojkania enalia]|uniref:Uncharacterized protein n=1 Tax=Lojkania enalia TaxID=147567 RepID=A0A9P4N0P5_9PLEO|nr:hypothetical protein CC78DRAFT_579561 [Didymosphaeria enalia]